jgi:hypothetical protein
MGNVVFFTQLSVYWRQLCMSGKAASVSAPGPM